MISVNRAWMHKWPEGNISLHASPEGATAFARIKEDGRPADNMPRALLITDEDLLKKVHEEKDVVLSADEFEKQKDGIKEL